MSYESIALCTADSVFVQRVMGCAAQEGEWANPGAWMSQHIWAVASAPEIEQAYKYALDQDNPNPGGDPGVITDAVILAHVQPLINPPAMPESEPES